MLDFKEKKYGKIAQYVQNKELIKKLLHRKPYLNHTRYIRVIYSLIYNCRFRFL